MFYYLWLAKNKKEKVVWDTFMILKLLLFILYMSSFVYMRSKRLFWALVIIANSIPIISLAQWRGPLTTQLGPTEGMSAIASQIVSDDDGYIYIASNVGLYRYDGNTFTFFGHDPLNPNSIAAGEVLTILPGQDGLIWLGMRLGGLNSFDPKTGKFKRYPLPFTSSSSEPTVNALYEDDDGILWVGAMQFRLLAFDRLNETFRSYSPEWIDPDLKLGRLSILSITPKPRCSDTLLLSILDYGSAVQGRRSFGLVAFEKQTGKFRDTPFFGKILQVDKDGTMWAKQWGNFIIRIDPMMMKQDTFVHHFYHNGRDLRPLSKDIIRYKDRLLIASSLAIMEYKDGVLSTIFRFPVEREVYCLFADRYDNVWIGTDQGIQVINPDQQHIRYFDLSYFGKFKRLFPAKLAYDHRSDAILLTYPMDSGLSGYFKIPLSEDAVDEPAFVPTSFQVDAVVVDERNRLWAVGDGNLYVKSNVNSTSPFQVVSVEDKVLPGIMYMSTDAHGRIGLIGRREFIWFHPDSMNFKWVHIADLQPSSRSGTSLNIFDGFSMTQNHHAYLFSNGIHKINLVTAASKQLKYDLNINPFDHQIQYVGEDAFSDIWLSSLVHTGRYRLVNDSLVLIQGFGPGQGMISPGANEIHIDSNGRIWTFTGNGLHAIDLRTNEVQVYGTKEGLPFPFLDPIQVIGISDDRIATVCHNGIIVYPAQELWDAGAHHVVPVVLSRLRIDKKNIVTGTEANETQSIVLPANNNGIDVEFQALAFPTDYRVNYSYRITGLQDTWISIGKNKLVTIPSMPSGDFVFEIKAGLPESNTIVKSLHIEVEKSLFEKPWFLLLLLGGVAAMVYSYMRYRLGRIRKQEEIRASVNMQMAELELKALRAQMNPHFMFNSLNSIKNYILRAEPKLAAEYLSNFAHLIRMILQNSREKLISLQSEMETLILYIELEQIRFENKFEFSFEVDRNIQIEQVMIPPMLLQPFVENAIWHGLMHKEGEGHLSIAFQLDDQHVICIIEDDGVGRSRAAAMKSLSASKYKSMGMGITQDRIEIMNKLDALGISSQIMDKTDNAGNANGTKVIIRITKPFDPI